VVSRSNCFPGSTMKLTRHMLGSLISRVVNTRLRFEPVAGGKVTVGRDVEGLRHVLFAGMNAVGRGTVFAGTIEIGYATTIGVNSYVHGPLRIGNYCQLGPAVSIYGNDHAVSYATSYVNSSLFAGRLKKHIRTEEVSIGHDVWIGHGAVILKGTRIGNGVIVGAGSVVTSSVPDYVVVVGNPARVLRPRFPAEVIDLLQQLEWWLLPAAELDVLEPLFHVDFDRATDEGISLLRWALGRVGRLRTAASDQPEIVAGCYQPEVVPR
jgi:acetyltransferase-like isoleucine patch superfamily enzyme